MGGLINLLTKLKALDVHATSLEALRQTKDALNELNREQLFDGLDRYGHDITLDGSPDYSPLTIEIKESKGQVTDRIILRDEGNFWREIKTDVTDKKVITQSTDPKTKKILERTGPTVMGVGGEFKFRYINQNLRPALFSLLRKQTGLK